MKRLCYALIFTLMTGGLCAHPGDDHEHYANAKEARAEAAKLLQQSLSMSMESLTAGEESVVEVIQHQRLLLEAERPAELPPIEGLLTLQKHEDFSDTVVEVIERRYETGAAKLQDVLIARANWALRYADHKDGLVVANAKAVEVMKASIMAGGVKEFRFDQVKEWKGDGLEEFGGTTCLIGLAAYKPDTIFGQSPVWAKAYIKDGEVQKWVYAKTGIEIK